MSAEVGFEEHHTTFLLFLFIMLSVAIVFIVILIVQIFTGPVGSRPAPNWVLVLFPVVFLFLSIAFRRYSMALTSDYLKVGFPLYHMRIPWGRYMLSGEGGKNPCIFRIRNKIDKIQRLVDKGFQYASNGEVATRGKG